MAPAANTAAAVSQLFAPVYSPIIAPRKRLNLNCSARFNTPPHLSYKQNPRSALFSTGTVRVTEAPSKSRNRLFTVFGCLADESGLSSEEKSKVSAEGQVASIDIKLPRRSLQVEFSCNSCGERTKRLINRLAYERGLVFVQCAGCLKHHKLVDNLGLIVEYDFRETSKGLDTDQV